MNLGWQSQRHGHRVCRKRAQITNLDVCLETTAQIGGNGGWADRDGYIGYGDKDT